MGASDQLEASENPQRRVVKSVAGFVVGLGLFALILWVLAPDWSELADRVEIDFAWLAIGLLGTTLASVVTAARWQLLAEAMAGTRLPYLDYFHGLVLTRLVGQFTSTLAMDLVGRGAALKAAGSERGLGHAATQVVLERLLDLVLPLVLLAWVIALRLPGWPADHPAFSLAICTIAFLLGAILLLRPSVHLALRAYLALRLRLDRIRRREVEASVGSPSLVSTVDTKLATFVAIHSLLRFAFVILQFWGIARAVGLPIEWLEMTMATPFGQLAGMVGLTPGGHGMLELGWAGGLGFVGFDEETITLFLLAQWPGVILYFGILTGLTLPFARRAKPRP